MIVGVHELGCDRPIESQLEKSVTVIWRLLSLIYFDVARRTDLSTDRE